MDEEEKRAIDYFKNLDISFNTLLRIDPNGFKYALDTILNLLENQQKEIESYKERYENMKWYFDNQEDNLIHKDKIKEKIKELENLKEQITTSECMLELSASVDILKELLGE